MGTPSEVGDPAVDSRGLPAKAATNVLGTQSANSVATDRGTDQAPLDRGLTLRTFDESTWKSVEAAKEAGPIGTAARDLSLALDAFLGDPPNAVWAEKRREFARLIEQRPYLDQYLAGYKQGLRGGIKQALGIKVTEIVEGIRFVTPSMTAIVGLYLQSAGTKPDDRELRKALSPGLAAATDIYTGPTKSLGATRSQQDLISNTWFREAVSIAKLLDEIEREGLLKTITYTVAALIKGIRQFGTSWIDGFYALNGQATKQGSYAGSLIGSAVAEVIWTAANFIAFESVNRVFLMGFEEAEGLAQAVRKLTLRQRLARIAAKARSMLAFIEEALLKDVPDVFYQTFVLRDPTKLERLLESARKITGGDVVRRARALKGGFVLEELIPSIPAYSQRIQRLEELLRVERSGVWNPSVHRVRRMWAYQYNSYSKSYEWMELGDGGFVAFPKEGVKTLYRAGLTNVFESKSAGVVEKAAALPDFKAGQIGKDFERLDVLPVKLEVEGLAGPGYITIVELKPGELFFSRKPPEVSLISGKNQSTFGTYWTVVAPPDADPATVARSLKKLDDAGFKGAEVWRHPMTDKTAQKISEAVIRFVDQEK